MPEQNVEATEETRLVDITAKLGQLLGSMDLGVDGAKSLIVIAYTLLIVNEVTEESVAEYCKDVWDGVTAEIDLRRRVAAFIQMPTPTAASIDGNSVH